MNFNIDLCIRVIVLFIFLQFVEYTVDKQKPYYNNDNNNDNDNIKKFSDETKFSCYRSLMCLFLSMYGLENTINNISKGYIEPFSYKNNSFDDIVKWFIAYLVLDIGKMAWMKNKRWDLYVHHVWCLISYWLAFIYGKTGFLHSMLLINESISIVSGVDSIYMEEKRMDMSKKCKLFRKKIIRYIRLPIWISMLLLTLRSSHTIPSALFYNGLITSCLMIWLDRYWEKKCDKVLDK